MLYEAFPNHLAQSHSSLESLSVFVNKENEQIPGY